jgi:hypothetical protein
MDDLYTQTGVIDMRVRLVKVVRTLATERGVQLNPNGPVFFDGSMSLPAPGAPWKLVLHSPLGKSATVVLSPTHLTEFKAGRCSPVTSRIERALDTLTGSRTDRSGA